MVRNSCWGLAIVLRFQSGGRGGRLEGLLSPLGTLTPQVTLTNSVTAPCPGLSDMVTPSPGETGKGVRSRGLCAGRWGFYGKKG